MTENDHFFYLKMVKNSDFWHFLANPGVFYYAFLSKKRDFAENRHFPGCFHSGFVKKCENRHFWHFFGHFIKGNHVENPKMADFRHF